MVVEDIAEDPESLFSIEAFNQAVSDDKKELAKEFGIAEEDSDAQSEAGPELLQLEQLSISEAVALVRDNSPFNWCLITPSCAAAQRA